MPQILYIVDTQQSADAEAWTWEAVVLTWKLLYNARSREQLDGLRLWVQAGQQARAAAATTNKERAESIDSKKLWASSNQRKAYQSHTQTTRLLKTVGNTKAAQKR